MSAHPSMLILAGCAGALCLALSGGAHAGEAAPQQAEPEPSPIVDEHEDHDPLWADDLVHAAIGRVIGSMVCTGALVLDPRIVITAAHCVVLPGETAVATPVTFQPSQPAGVAHAAFEGSVWALGSPHQHGVQLAHDASNDWAIVVLDEPPVGVVPLRVRSHSTRELRGLVHRVILPHQPAGIGDPVAPGPSPACSVIGMLANVILHDCHASYGGSGLPLLIWDGERLVLVGVHTGGVALRSVASGEIVLAGGSAVRAISFLSALRNVHGRLQRRDRIACAGAC